MRSSRLAIGVCALTMLLAIPVSAAPSGDYDADSLWSDDQPQYAQQQLAMGGDGVFPNYRIPALAVTNAGTVLASYDGRPTGIDAPGPNSILQRRSEDNGKTWGEQTVINAGKADPKEGYSDPSYLVDRETGTIFNFHVKSYNQGFFGSKPGVDPNDREVLHAYVAQSDDDGKTWTSRDITAEITPDLSIRSRFASSGQGIQLKYGKYKGRLIQQYAILPPNGDPQSVSIYSDDHGKTWQSGEPFGTGMDENKTVELSDGTVMLNSRDSARSGYRKVAYSTDGGHSYGPWHYDKQLIDPTNNGSILRAYPNAKQGSAEAKVLLFSNAATTDSRSNGTVRVSCDDGKTWPISKVFAKGAMAYSTLATLPDGKIGLLWEPGHNGIIFSTFNTSWLNGLCAPLTADEVEIERGTTGSAEITVENQFGPAISVDSLTAKAPQGWTVELDGTPTTLAAGGTATVTAKVAVPAGASGGTYQIPLTLTDKSGRTSSGTLTVIVPKTADEVDGRIAVTVKHTNPKEIPYAVGDVLKFNFHVTNLSNATTKVVPSGNLEDFDPATAKKNCRYSTLGGKKSYDCPFPYHVVTQEDLDKGSFTPETTWVSTSGSDVTTIKLSEPTIQLVETKPEPTEEPTEEPTVEPTEEPTVAPTDEPTTQPTADPSEPVSPTATAAPSAPSQPALPITGSSGTALAIGAGALLLGGLGALIVRRKAALS